MSVPRLRMFAGPNGSGKSSLIRLFAREFSANGLFQLHHYINADDLLRDLQSSEGIPFGRFGLSVTGDELRANLEQSNRVVENHPFLSSLKITNGVLTAPIGASDSYVAAAIADFLREQLLGRGDSFSFETVMSHPSKVEFLARARAKGYRTYLYFVATESPLLNVKRVDARIGLGGHSVPEEKIGERYERSLQLVAEALSHAYRGFVFDNSSSAPELLAELNPAGELEIKVPTQPLPLWFVKHVMPRYDQ